MRHQHWPKQRQYQQLQAESNHQWGTITENVTPYYSIDDQVDHQQRHTPTSSASIYAYNHPQGQSIYDQVNYHQQQGYAPTSRVSINPYNHYQHQATCVQYPNSAPVYDDHARDYIPEPPTGYYNEQGTGRGILIAEAPNEPTLPALPSPLLIENLNYPPCPTLNPSAAPDSGYASGQPNTSSSEPQCSLFSVANTDIKDPIPRYPPPGITHFEPVCSFSNPPPTIVPNQTPSPRPGPNAKRKRKTNPKPQSEPKAKRSVPSKSRQNSGNPFVYITPKTMKQGNGRKKRSDAKENQNSRKRPDPNHVDENGIQRCESTIEIETNTGTRKRKRG